MLRISSICNLFIFCLLNSVAQILPSDNYKNFNLSSFGSTNEQINNFTGTLYYIPNTTQRLPDFSTLEPVGQIYTDCINIPNQDFNIGFPGVSDRYEYFAIDYKGQFYLSDSGYYHFMLGSDDGSKLFIDNKLVIDNDFQHAFISKSTTIKIGKGVHPIEVQYFQGPKTYVGLILNYKRMDDERFQLFNLTKFYPIAVEEHEDKIDVAIGNEILFDVNSAKISASAKKALADIKRIIIDKNIVKSITVNGYTDDIGSETFNLKLSLRRADAVKGYFQEIGINPDLLICKGYGKSKPKVPNIDEACRQQNRRIELSIEKVSNGNEGLSRLKDSITSEHLKSYVANLCDEKIGNRNFASQGERKAACYIRDQFIQSGLNGEANGVKNYFQEYIFAYDSIIGASLQKGTTKARYKSEFIFRDFCFLPQTSTLNIVYAGFGLDRPEYSDYNTINVKNKWVLVEANSPIDSAGNVLKQYDLSKAVSEYEMDNKIETAKKHGALGVIFRINNRSYMEMFSSCNCYTHCSKDHTALNRFFEPFPVIYSKQDAIDLLLGIETIDHIKLINSQLNKGNPVSAEMKIRLLLKIEKRQHTLNSQNVVGIIKGRHDKVGMFVTAHYDAIKRQDTIFYKGANDNASGTAAVIQLANVYGRLVKTGIIPERTIVFVAFSGEENILIGSEYFNKHNPFLTDSSTIAINLDCIGAADSVNLSQASSATISTTDEELAHMQDNLFLLGMQQSVPLTLGFNNGISGSDHATFIHYGIRAIHISTSGGAMHSAMDTPESLNYENYENVTRFAYDLIRNYNQFAKVKK